jgi:hypothetical protein
MEARVVEQLLARQLLKGRADPRAPVILINRKHHSLE